MCRKPNSVSRSLKPSDYAHAMGAYTGCDDFAGCNYWLSSPGSTEDSAAGITCSGFVDKTGSSVHNISSAVVPVLRIDLSSVPERAVLPCNGDKFFIVILTVDWSYVCFGSYPQREVKGKALTSAVTGASYDANGDALVDG